MSDSEPVRLHLTFTGDSEALARTLREYIRPRPAPARQEEPNWVLVKHWHDSGGIEGVYGPYTKERASWLLAEMTGTSDAWTVAELQKGQED